MKYLPIVFGGLFTLLALISYIQYLEINSLNELVTIQSETIVSSQDTNQKMIAELRDQFDQYRSGSDTERAELEGELAHQELEFQTQLQEIERKKQLSQQLLDTTNKDLVSNIDSLTEKIFSLEKNSKTSLAAKWDDILVQLACDFPNDESSFGSGVYFKSGPQIEFGAGNDHVILTNSHVIEESDNPPLSCEIIFNSGEVVNVVASEDETVNPFSFFTDFDAGFITLTQEQINEIDGIDKTVQYNLCTVIPDSGEEIIALGYPKIGSTEGITVTEGIISGKDEEYFITSAKIGKGNSGGAAISVKNDCYFGIPTLVRADEVESLGRILDITSIFE